MGVVLLLIGVVLMAVFLWVDYLTFEKECEHETIATYESFGFRQCIDCLEKFKLKGKK